MEDFLYICIYRNLIFNKINPYIMIQENKIPKYTQKDVLRIMQISQATLYRLRKKNNLLTKNVKRRYTEEEIEMLGVLLLEQYI